MFGRQAKLPIDFNLEEDYDPDKKLEQHLGSHDPPEEAIAMHRKIEETVKKNVEKAQRKQKEYYDEKHSASSCYTVGWFPCVQKGLPQKEEVWWEIR